MKKQITLQQYIFNRGITQEQAALELGITRPYLNMVLSGKRPAGRPLCVKLSEWSGGKIDLMPLMMIQAESKAA